MCDQLRECFLQLTHPERLVTKVCLIYSGLTVMDEAHIFFMCWCENLSCVCW